MDRPTIDSFPIPLKRGGSQEVRIPKDFRFLSVRHITGAIHIFGIFREQEMKTYRVFIRVTSKLPSPIVDFPYNSATFLGSVHIDPVSEAHVFWMEV